MAWPRVGIDQPDRSSAVGALSAVRRLEAAGVPALWTVTGGRTIDALTVYAAAAVQSERIVLGTGIIPTYPRHPFVTAQQTLAVHQLAPGRVRLGLGPSHRPIIEGSLGIPMVRPLSHLREYVTIVRALLWEGQVDFQGEFFRVRQRLPEKAPVPIYTSALRPKAFHLAGEIADGVLSWMCPPHYIHQQAVPALEAGAQAAGRSRRPRLVVHVPVVMTTDVGTMREKARPVVGLYGRMPFYAEMFATAGFPLENSVPSDALLEHLVVWGDQDAVGERLARLLESEIDELLTMLIPVNDHLAEEAALASVLAALDRRFGWSE
ncbi:LLM class flavin-dependent oxidoreductase [Thermomicrobium sp. CFH 73360]|uniref:LLM class flavin-dependent oxidoreductase n=1 Tax=Thermomicrobium sp. CFH 73360 TaxID=2951987 RepID=UPI002077295F|nr:LLM class flavin-dependent oxidoreductase [Thermomicrobium sp. CFH 73360]MCM8745995.1 LLM class flavin-dependent oxidoreductase [Thermomicrobium sp. CFH 73360]